MANMRYHNGTYSAGIPTSVGDKYYAQDLFRDFWSTRENIGINIQSLLKNIGACIISGCEVTQGAGNTVNISAGQVQVKFQTTFPTNWSALPPATSNGDIYVIVEVPALTNQAIAGADTGGSNTNYLKIAYAETSTSVRTRQKKSGTYNSEITPSYTLTCNTTSPTTYEIAISTFTNNGATSTFTNGEVRFNKAIAVTTTYTAKIYDGYISGSGTFTINLPSIATAKYQKLIINNIGIGDLTLDPNSSETIEGQATVTLNPAQKVFYLYCNGIEWKILDYRGSYIPVVVDTTIADYIPSESILLANPNTASQYGVLKITLPLIANSKGKKFIVRHGLNGGLIKIIPNASNSSTLNFKGSLTSLFFIFNFGEQFEFSCDGTYWNMKGLTTIRSGFVARSVWSGVSVGSAFTYNTKSSGVDFTGLIIQEATSLNIGVVVFDSGGTGTSGILYVMNVTGTGIWTHTRTVTATYGSALTVAVNEGSGSSKNISYNIYHGQGLDLYQIEQIRIFMTPAASASWTNARDRNGTDADLGTGNTYGQNLVEVDTNTVKILAGGSAGAIGFINDSFTYQSIDGYYAYTLEFRS